MPRINNVIRQVLTASEVVEVPVSFPGRPERFVIQPVLFRQRFEDDTTRDPLCSIELLFEDGAHTGAMVQFGGGTPTTPVRPGGRKLWSTARWTFEQGLTDIRIRVEAHQAFDCRIDLDVT